MRNKKGGKAMRVFFRFSSNTGKRNIIDALGPKVVGLSALMTRLELFETNNF